MADDRNDDLANLVIDEVQKVEDEISRNGHSYRDGDRVGNKLYRDLFFWREVAESIP